MSSKKNRPSSRPKAAGEAASSGRKPGEVATGPRPANALRSAGGGPRLYTLEVFLISGPVTPKFVKKNPVVSRTIQMRGDQTLEDLHNAIFEAYGRWDEHMYEFQFGKGPMDPKGPRYTMEEAFAASADDENPPAGRSDRTKLDNLGLKVGTQFGYWFDFGDDWWHQISVEDIAENAPPGRYPKVVKRVGDNPPQYPE